MQTVLVDGGASTVHSVVTVVSNTQKVATSSRDDVFAFLDAPAAVVLTVGRASLLLSTIVAYIFLLEFFFLPHPCRLVLRPYFR